METCLFHYEMLFETNVIIFSIVTVPPILNNKSKTEIKMYIENSSLIINDTQFINYTQNVERFIQDITKIAIKNFEKNRNGVIRVTLQSRSKLSNFKSKKDFKKMFGNFLNF